MTDANSARRHNDLKKLRDLSDKSSGKISIKSTHGIPVNEILVEINCITAPSSKYPESKQGSTLVSIQLSSRYPFQEPTATIKTPIFHPNVYASGKICFGKKWLPTEGLDLLVKRIIKIVTYDPAILNDQSPANGDALVWYRSAKKTYPAAFPTDCFNIPNSESTQKMMWNTISDEKVIVNCLHCSIRLSLPKGKSGVVKCPKCLKSFETST